MNKPQQIEKLQKAKDLILEVRNDYENFGEYGSLNTIAEEIEEQRAIFEADN